MQKISLVLVVTAFTITGLLHFIRPAGFVKIVPDYLGHALTLVYVSGVFELLGAAGMLFPKYRKAAAIGLIALLVAVYPANIYMLMHPAPDLGIPRIYLWLRLPFQALFIYIVWLAGIKRSNL